MKIHHWAVFLLGLFVAMSFAPDLWTWHPAGEAEGSTRLVFFQDGGPYLSDLDVQVSDETGTPVMTTITRGPLLVLDLPDGHYTVKVRRPNGPVHRARIAVERGRMQRVPVQLPAR